MKKTRRDIHKEIMYNKIMPTSHARKNADLNSIDNDENDFGFYYHEHSEDEEPETAENPEQASQAENNTPEEENNDEIINNDSIVKILSEYNEYKDKKAARKELQESEDEDSDEDNDEISDNNEDISEKENDDTDKSENITERNKENQYPKLINIKEIMINNKIDEVLEKFNCCKCNSCKLEITAIALNRLTPQYTICHSDEEIENAVPNSEYSKITSALINAIITIRANPIHK